MDSILDMMNLHHCWVYVRLCVNIHLHLVVQTLNFAIEFFFENWKLMFLLHKIGFRLEKYEVRITKEYGKKNE